MLPPTIGYVVIDSVSDALVDFLSARALKFLRQKNLIHRDIKPQVWPSTLFASDD